MKVFTAIANPYIVGNPIKASEMFFGRSAIFNGIQDALQNNHRMIVLSGDRRSGKTSILFQILNGKLQDHYLPVLIDMQTMAGINSDAEFIQRIIEEISRAFGSFKEDEIPVLGDDPYRAFRKFLDLVAERLDERRLLLLVDEYEIIDAKIFNAALSDRLIHFIKSIIEDFPQIAFILTGSKDLRSQEKKNWRIIEEQSLRIAVDCLTEIELQQLVITPLAGVVLYDDESLSKIYRLTAGQPFYTQLICQQIIDILNRETTYQVEANIIDRAVEEIIESPPPQVAYFWSSLSKRQQQLASLVAEQLTENQARVDDASISKALNELSVGNELTANNYQLEIDKLIKNNVLKIENENIFFKLDLLRHWIARDHSIWQLINQSRLQSVERAGQDVQFNVVTANFWRSALFYLALFVSIILSIIFFGNFDK